MFNHRYMLNENCPNCGSSPAYKLMKVIDSRGMERYPYYCSNCGERTTLFEKKKLVPDYIKNGLAAIVYRRNTSQIKPNRIGVCERCGAHGAVEEHHWAPRKLFSDFDKWPTSDLCRPCHEKWHQIVTGDLIKRSGKI